VTLAALWHHTAEAHTASAVHAWSPPAPATAENQALPTTARLPRVLISVIDEGDRRSSSCVDVGVQVGSGLSGGSVSGGVVQFECDAEMCALKQCVDHLEISNKNLEMRNRYLERQLKQLQDS
jgi:hypothetical protein